MQIPLGNIYLETFDSTSVLHQQVLEDLLTQSSSRFISSIASHLNLNQGLKSFPFDTAFLVRVESGEVVGYVFISKIIQD